MNLTQLIQFDLIQFGFTAKDKKDALNKLTDMLVEEGIIGNKDEFYKALLGREELSTTGVGDGIAIPHAKASCFEKAMIIYAKSDEGVEWESFDAQPAKHIFMICAPANGADEHLKALATLSTALMNPEVKGKLDNATTKEEVKTIFEDFVKSTEKVKEKPKEENGSEDKKYIIAVTACPTGIAHTFMAAEKIKEAAKEMGLDVKVETNGQIGVENKLTKDDIERAVGIIVAADKKVEIARFDGHPTLFTKVADGINKPKELIQTVLDGNAAIYHHSGEKSSSESTEGESVGRKIYKYLMEGVSNMLPFVVAGGILIALSFFWGINAFNPEDPSYNKFAELLFVLGKLAFSMMLPILAGFIGRSIADRPGFIVGMVGGILADPSILGLKSVAWLNYTPSGFLGALVAGFLAGGIIIALRYIFSWIPRSLDGIKPIFLFPVLGSFIMGVLMLFVVNAPMAFIMTSFKNFIEALSGGEKVILGFVVGSMMAIDMGGPINKAAYVTATALVTTSGTAGSDVMAASMVGGMIPPLAIALSATIYKNLWPETQRGSALVNYVMGFAFITEGAIPFAASNPIRVIPPLFLSSGVAGALSMIFDCRSRAPHGGMFAVLVGAVTNPVIYLIALVIGTVMGAFLLIVSLNLGKKKEN
ncbi:phosphoenolpyruvate-dependent sugar PTS family porter, EIIA 2 component [Lachnoanaerobaculum sp. MSX33]|uniref:PTS fructose transporter subunit IIABC n=1 Tax=Lachnoanaerobaculum sp. MSX33 TaxID=936596 RepID=UPI0003DFAA1A|nr:fructose-specific PTS transporter subunit EIIC [Lachnoanaerobaculum sp. MSX33]ETO97440.1 phosphoenolpyruvate-dependent sugar PTS family porter, EIIA 2 component [Lachnoanaerobaculum sp. MSX33]